METIQSDSSFGQGVRSTAGKLRVEVTLTRYLQEAIELLRGGKLPVNIDPIDSVIEP